MIDLRFLGTAPIAVLGLGRTGLAAISALQAAEIPVFAWDDDQTKHAAATARGAVVTPLDDDTITRCRILVLSPGVNPMHAIVGRAFTHNLKIVSDIDLLWRANPHATYVAITGTNGKSTTTSVVAHILREAGYTIEVGGNLGQPVLEFGMLGTDGIYVLELSSYQLDLCPMARFDHVVVLNISPDHLERHGTMTNYIEAKKNILRPRRDRDTPQTAIIGLDDAHTVRIFEDTNGLPPRTTIGISGLNHMPDGISVIGRILSDAKNELRFDMASIQTLPGPHNGQNAAAAYAVCRALGLKPAEIMYHMESFPGLVHRQQLVASIDGVEFVNDSKGTNADATAKALACYNNIYWIAGGHKKDASLNGLEIFRDRIQTAYLIGESEDEFAIWCRQHQIPFTRCGTLDQAVVHAFQDARADRRKPVTILLSPATKSYDQYNNFEERGQHFIEAVDMLGAH